MSGPDVKTMLSSIPPADAPPMNISVVMGEGMTPQQVLDAVIGTMMEAGIEPPDPAETEGGAAEPAPTRWQQFKIDLEAAGREIDRDPFEQYKFAGRLIDYESAFLEVCWSMREKLEQAESYVSGVPAWKTLLEQSVELTARIQQLAGALADLGRVQKVEAKRLMDLASGDLSSIL